MTQLSIFAFIIVQNLQTANAVHILHYSKCAVSKKAGTLIVRHIYRVMNECDFLCPEASYIIRAAVKVAQSYIIYLSG